MNPFQRIFTSLRRAVAAFFRHDLALRRAPGGVHIVLQERPTVGRGGPPSRAELVARKDQQDLTLMQQQLAELLNDLPETRSTLRHLVFVEKALQRKGLRALHKLPLDVLQRGLEQLEGLVVNWSPTGLAALRSKMAVAIIDREHCAGSAEAEADAYRTASLVDSMPADASLDGLDVRSDDEALAAAYAALGDLAPANVELQGELGSPSAKVLAREAAVRLREPMT